MIHQRAVEHLLVLEGAALLRSFVEESEPAFTRARVAEMRRWPAAGAAAGAPRACRI